jgi:hypothetical protein
VESCDSLSFGHIHLVRRVVLERCALLSIASACYRASRAVGGIRAGYLAGGFVSARAKALTRGCGSWNMQGGLLCA